MKPRNLTWLVMVALLAAIILAISANAGDEPPPAATTEPTPDPAPTQERRLQGLTIDGWHRVASRYLHRVRALRTSLRRDPETSSAIRLACILYPGAGCSWLWRVAGCESHLYRYARNPSSGAAGVYQFLESTWAHTPFRALSVYDPYANAMAAGWLASRGGRGQWVCR